MDVPLFLWFAEIGCEHKLNAGSCSLVWLPEKRFPTTSKAWVFEGWSMDKRVSSLGWNARSMQRQAGN